MKKIINIISILIFTTLVLSGCKEDTEYKDGKAELVGTLLEPVADYSFNIINSPSASLMFEWTATNGNPKYTVLFYSDAEGKDLLYSTLSDNQGEKATLDLSHETLSKIADRAGIQAGKIGDIYWNVSTSVGGESKISEASNKLTIKRFHSFSDIPVSLYLTGSATEVGESIANAIPMIKDVNSKGKFEVITELKAGKYNFVNRNEEGDKRTFGYDAEGLLIETTEAVEIETEDAGVYRISVNFESVDEVELLKISKLEFYYPSDNNLNKELVYQGNSKWTTQGVVVPSGDNRYHFRATTIDAKSGDEAIEWWGHKDRDTQTVPSELKGSYYDVFIIDPQSDNWHYTFKFMDAIKGQTVGFMIDMSSGAYTHSIEVGEIVVPKIKSLDTPANGTKLSLEKSADSKVNFKWTPETITGPSAKYKVIFFGDAAGTNVLAEIGADGFNTSVDITHTSLEEIAAKAGITSPLGEGDVYWGIRSTVITETELSSLKNKLTIKRRAGTPTSVAIIGDGTEYGVTGMTLKTVSEGKFEIYTKLTGGFNFKDNNGDIYYIDGNAIKPGINTTTLESGIYRLTLDFNENTAKAEYLDKVYYFLPDNNSKVEAAYQGNGVWKIENFKAPGRDTRYHFRADVNGIEEKERWCCVGSDVDLSPISTLDENDPFYRVRAIQKGDISDGDWNDNWRPTWKFGDMTAGKTINIYIKMSPDIENYHHQLELLD